MCLARSQVQSWDPAGKAASRRDWSFLSFCGWVARKKRAFVTTAALVSLGIVVFLLVLCGWYFVLGRDGSCVGLNMCVYEPACGDEQSCVVLEG